MKRLLLALALATLALIPASQGQVVTGPYVQVGCSTLTNVAVGGTGLARILQGQIGKVIYVCGWSVTNTGASGTFQLSYGTGTNCGTGTTAITAVLSVGTTAVTDHTQYATISLPQIQPFNSAAQNDLCINFSVATLSAIVYTGQY